MSHYNVNVQDAGETAIENKSKDNKPSVTETITRKRSSTRKDSLYNSTISW